MTGTNEFPPRVNFDKTATIDGSTKSGVIDLMGCTLTGIRTPANMSGTGLTFESGDSMNGTFLPLRDSSNTAIGVTIDNVARQYQVDPVKFAGVRFLKVVSSAAETAKDLVLVTRPV